MAFTYSKLYRRVRESTGLDVLTPGTMQAIIENCMADLTSRGYRDFVEVRVLPEDSEEAGIKYTNHGYGLYSFEIPDNLRKILYLKVAVTGKMLLGLRLSITDDRVNCIVVDNRELRTSFTNIEQSLIFYTNNGRIYLELRDRNADIIDIRFGYDKKIVVPEEPKVENYDTTIIDVRKEYEDAIVLYGIYQVYNRYSKEIDRIQMSLNNYKYFVEDITATLAHEDDYDREQGTKILEHV